MSEMTALERGYRRMLACYPRSFRRESADEVLAVLLEAAAAGQARVGLAEAWDLVRGGVRLWLAWANGKGQDWARMLLAACFGLLTWSVLAALAQHAAAVAPATMIAAAAVWATGLASVVLIFTPAACRYYRPPLARQ